MASSTNDLVFIPMFGAGHLHTTLQLVNLLLSHDFRLSATVLLFPDSPSPPVVGDYSVKFVQLPPLSSSESQSEDISSQIDSQKDNVRNVVAEIVRQGSPSKLVGIVIDFFCTSMIAVAEEFGVPSYLFYTSSASYLGILFHLQSLLDNENMDLSQFVDADTELNVSAFVNPLPTKVIPGALLQGPIAKKFLGWVKLFRETKGIIVNTFIDLESHAIGALSSGNFPKIYPVGPIIYDGKDEKKQQKFDSVIKWLDDQPATSVVFLCFGSMGSFGEAQVKEIAVALERSGFRFLWSLRKPSMNRMMMPSPGEYEDPSEVLPEGFLERTAGRGKVIGWAPQLAVLSQPAVGGFVSHCGWNSTLESVWTGVPMATWPLYAEQTLNAFMIVSEIGNGVEVKMDYNRNHMVGESPEALTAELLEGSIRKLMKAAAGEEEGAQIKVKVTELREKSRAAVAEGGSSFVSVGRLIEDIINYSS